MIPLTLFIIMIVSGLMLKKKSTSYDNRYISGSYITVLGSLFLIVSLIIIAVINANTDKYIQENQMVYEGLCKRYDIIKSEPENPFKLDVIKDITDWNIKVYNTKYWSESLWVNCFYPKRVADNLHYIPLDDE